MIVVLVLVAVCCRCQEFSEQAKDSIRKMVRQQLTLMAVNMDDAVEEGSYPAAVTKGETADQPLTLPLDIDDSAQESLFTQQMREAEMTDRGVISDCTEPMVAPSPEPEPTPDPGCWKLGACYDCISNRKCGWCAVMKQCVTSRNPKPECARSTTTPLCPAPCEDMFQMNWPAGRQNLVQSLCDAIDADYATKHVVKRVHFTD
jgi:hypothetical protein